MAVAYSHCHCYCDALADLKDYKELEAKLNAFAPNSGKSEVAAGADTEAGRKAWLELSDKHGDPVTGKCDPKNYVAASQDLVAELLIALGWRVTGFHENDDTKSFCVTSPDVKGAKFVMTSHKTKKISDFHGDATVEAAQTDTDVFNVAQLKRHSSYHKGRQGISILAFTVSPGEVDRIHAKYQELHPKLLTPGSPKSDGAFKMLEVYAYYAGEVGTDADCGTLIRFVEDESGGPEFCVLPGMKKVDATFDGISQSAFSDHWVSNVASRIAFSKILNDTMDWVPKVDFNAGVIAAGEAMIESTVIGNNTNLVLETKEIQLRDQHQVYLPTNNAVTKAGHVHHYIDQIGQGVQHIASRVSDLSSFIQRANDYREMTGAGMSFLSIPPMYYGYLSVSRLAARANVDEATATTLMKELEAAKVVDDHGVVPLNMTAETVKKAFSSEQPENVVATVLQGRYNCIYDLLKDNVSEASYLCYVRNNILVDIQGEDMLLQIFSDKILRREAKDEGPFFEWIERKCSEKVDPNTGKSKPLRPGCGGFGIRNFLALFLSIEVTKSTQAKAEADARNDADASKLHGDMVEAYTNQLNEANPILTAISDAMTLEGEAIQDKNDAEAAKQSEAKNKATDDLGVLSRKYLALIKKLKGDYAHDHEEDHNTTHAGM